MTVSRTEPMKMKMSAVITNTPHGGTCSFVLMAIPLFIFAGTIVPGAQISIAWLYFAVLISAVLMTIYAAVNLCEALRGKSHTDATHEDTLRPFGVDL
jgi:TRAP-type C4-dicarboxylate transport system permease small subunit